MRHGFSALRTTLRTTLVVCVTTTLLAACGGGGGDGGEITTIAPLSDEGGGGDGSGPGALSGQTAGAAESCGPITIARMDWPSADAIAEIDRFILEEGFGCETALVDGDTMPSFRSMVEGDGPDLVPALWIDAFREEFDAAVAAGDVLPGARTIRGGGFEGWWIPRAIAEANPDIRTVEDALARPELFPVSDEDASGAIHTCPSGWNCQVSNENLFRAYGADAMGFVLVDPGTAEGLDESVTRAVADGRGWLGYYWSPTALVGRLDLVRLDSPPHDPLEWARCTAVPDCPDPMINGYASSEVRVALSPDFAAKAGVAMGYAAGRGWDHATVNAVLVWMDDNGADGEAAARHFLRNFEDVWTTWVDEETAARVRAAL